MSRAFVREDAEVFERASRRRSGAGLPPGAVNYITADGVTALRARLAALKNFPLGAETEISKLESALASATVVEPQGQSGVVTFGATVLLRGKDGSVESKRIVGVDEVELASENVSWVLPLGRTLLGAEVGQRIPWPDDDLGARVIVEIRPG